MKNTKTIRVLALLLLACMMLTACGGSGNGNAAAPAVDADGNVEYRVVLTDALGNTYHDGIIVKFLQDGQEIAMQVVGEDGTAVKKLPAGEYTVELVYTAADAPYSYDADTLTLTAEAPELTIMMTQSVALEVVPLFAGDKEHEAYVIGLGCTQVSLHEGRTYFLFTPEQAGNYEFGVEGDAATVGYYGAPHFVQSASAVDVVNNKVQVSVSASSMGSTLVIGLDHTGTDSCVLTAQRIGDAIRTLADEPWHVYQKTAELSPYTLPAGAQIAEFDLTAETGTYNLVLNEADGFYHLDSADGPLVLVRLGVQTKYILESVQFILSERTGFVKYFFDDKGDFVKKESYTECLLEYCSYIDEEAGVYPLTEDLKYMIQQTGDHSGWWEFDGPGYIFRDESGNAVANINPDIAWLLLCCYLNG